MFSTKFSITLHESVCNDSILLGKKMREYVSRDMVKSFVQHKMGISFKKCKGKRYKGILTKFETEQNLMEAYLARYNTELGCFETGYYIPSHGYGRVEPTDYLSLSKMHRPTRHALAAERYIDIDMCNCHPVLFAQIARSAGLACSTIESYSHYCDQYRQTIMDVYQCSKDIAKQLPISLCFGGGIIPWKLENIELEYRVHDIPEIIELEKELAPLMKLLLDANPRVAAALLEYDPVKYGDPDQLMRSVMSMWSQTVERLCQEACVEWLVSAKGFVLEDIVPCQDGIMILKELWYDGILSDMSKVVRQKLDLGIQWSRKPFDKAITIPALDVSKPETPNRLVEDDMEAARLIVSDLSSVIRFSKGRLFFQKNHIWLSEKTVIDNHILFTILNSNIKKAGKKGDVSYAQNYRSAECIRRNVLTILTTESVSDDTIYAKLHTTTKGRLCFRDGVYDFPSKKFYLWNDVDFEYYSTQMINMDFAEYFQNQNKEVIDTLIKSVFEPLFGEDVPKALHFLSRAVAGHSEDKNWASYLGNRNCGKGVIYGLLKAAFGDYVGAFDISKIMYERQRQDISEVSRKLYWLLDLEFVRLAISQETPDKNSRLLINSKIWKTMCGGDDTLIARRNYDREDTYFTIDTTFFSFGNEELRFDTQDVFEQGIQFASSVKFRSQEYIDHIKANAIDPLEWSNLRVADPHIKDKCKTVEWGVALIHILMDSYSLDVVVVKQDKEEEDEIPLRRRILLQYEITGNENDIMIVADVVSALDSSKKKCIEEMKSLGVAKRECRLRGNYRGKVCFFGIRERPRERPDGTPETDNEEER